MAAKDYLKGNYELPVLNSAVSLYRRDVSQEAGGPSMTRQEFAEECDINNIMARYKSTGLIPVNGEPRYLDLTMHPDNLMDAMNQVLQAEEAFMTLPAIVRKEFDNDAIRFVEYASDPANLDKMREWGLAPPAPEPERPMRVEVVSPPTAPKDEPAKT